MKTAEDVVGAGPGRRIERLDAIPSAEPGTDQRLAALERAGLLRRPTGKTPDWLWKELPAAKDPTGSVVNALLDERDER